MRQKLLQETNESLGEEDERSVADLLVEQVEFADLIVVSKTDLIQETDLKRANCRNKDIEYSRKNYFSKARKNSN